MTFKFNWIWFAPKNFTSPRSINSQILRDYAFILSKWYSNRLKYLSIWPCSELIQSHSYCLKLRQLEHSFSDATAKKKSVRVFFGLAMIIYWSFSDVSSCSTTLRSSVNPVCLFCNQGRVIFGCFCLAAFFRQKQSAAAFLFWRHQNNWWNKLAN